MRLQELTHDDICTLKLEGEIDLHFAPILRTVLVAKAKAQCPALLLDLTGVEFIDSTGLAAIIEYLRESAKFGGRFCIGGIGEQLRSTFEIVRLDRSMPIFTEAASARDALRRDRLPPASEPLFVSAA